MSEKYILGIDIGGSTTKAVFFRNGNLEFSEQLNIGGRIPDIEGFISDMLKKNNIPVWDIEKIILTGVGSSYISSDIKGVKTFKVDEFEALGKGASILSGLDNALIVSMGTGTAYIRLEQGKVSHIGGSGVGGGTLIGLSSLLYGEQDIYKILELAEKGDLSKVDLQIKDICDTEIPNLPMHATAANFGKIEGNACSSDTAVGLLNMIFQTIGMLAVFVCKCNGIKDIILTGTMTGIAQGKQVFDELGILHGLNFIIPENAIYAGAIGAVFVVAGNN